MLGSNYLLSLRDICGYPIVHIAYGGVEIVVIMIARMQGIIKCIREVFIVEQESNLHYSSLHQTDDQHSSCPECQRPVKVLPPLPDRGSENLHYQPSQRS